MGVGVAEAGLVPASYSLISDLFPPQKRQSALLIFMGAVYVSASLGVSLGGALMEWVGDHLRSIPGELSRAPVWRLTFVMAAAPGLALAGLFLGAPEPARQERRARGQANSGEAPLIPFLIGNWVAVGGMCFVLTGVGLGVDAILMWLPTMLHRGYGLAPSRSGEWLGLALAFGSVIGVAGAATLTRILQPRRSETAPLIVLGFATTGAALILPGLAFVRGVDQVMGLCAAYFIFAFMGSSVGPSIMTAITPNHLRGRIVAIWGCVNLGAAVIWPPLIGWLSDHVFHGPTGLLLAFCAVALPVGFAAPLILVFIAKQVRRAMGIEASATGSLPLSHESAGA
jgi:MFS family permease